MKEERCRVVEQLTLGPRHFVLKLESPHISRRCRPGNFVMMAVSEGYDPLLKRPFGILDANPPTISIYYEIIGRGTALISRLRPGDAPMVIGPLGNTFPVLEDRKVLAIAGGRGIAPLFYALKAYRHTNKTFLAYGARSRDELNLLEQIDGLALNGLHLYTEDGSVGSRGRVTDETENLVANHGIDVTLSCGPEAMFHSLHSLLAGTATDDYVSMEAIMGCGFGICQSCIVSSADNGFKKVCSEGPVFKMEELAWST